MLRDRLLERIRHRDQHPLDREDDDPGREVEAIARHLAKLLNTRQGGVPINPLYGIPDFTNIPGETLTDMGQEMQRALLQVVASFEPRLDQVRVQFDAGRTSVLALRFRVEGTLRRDPRIPVALATVVGPEGKVQVGS